MSGQVNLPVSFTLKFPIEHEGETIDALTFNEMTLGAQIEFEDLLDTFETPPTRKNTQAASIFTIAALSGQPEAVLLKLRATDVRGINELVERIVGVAEESDADDEDLGNDGEAVPD